MPSIKLLKKGRVLNMGINPKHKSGRFSAILMLAVVMICMLLSAGCQTKTTIEEIQERGVLKVGTTGDYMPVSYLDPKTGEYVGFDIELAEDLADDLDVDLEYVKTSWPSLMRH